MQPRSMTPKATATSRSRRRPTTAWLALSCRTTQRTRRLRSTRTRIWLTALPTPPPNAAPTVETDAGNVSGNEGSELTNSGAFSDADGNSTLTITKQSGAGTVTDNGNYTDTPAANSVDGTFPDGPASSTVSVSANDGDATGSDSIEVTVANVAPTVTLTGQASVNEGSTHTY